MEQLNRLEIRGNVGNVNILRVGDTRVAHFSVVIETTWHNVTAWEGNKGIPSLDIICKGFPVYVAGRLRSQKYTANDGTERTSMEVIASTVEPVDGNVSAQC